MAQTTTKGARILVLFVLLCGLILLAPTVASAKAWRGIEPLHSTRADVKRLLGPLNVDQSPDTLTYDFPGERVFISFWVGTCEEGLPGGWRVRKDTVSHIRLELKLETKIAEVLTPGKEYEQGRGFHTPHVYYTDSEEGISFVVAEGFVQQIQYGPSAKDEKELSCSEVKYAAPVLPGLKLKSGGVPAFESFGNVRSDEAKARLDNFAIQLSQMNAEDPSWRGYIIVYAGRRSYLGEAQHKASCYKNYLVRVRGMDAASLFAVDGGFRDSLQVELYFGRADHYPPVLWPTVSPKKAHIIKRRLRRCSYNNFPKA